MGLRWRPWLAERGMEEGGLVLAGGLFRQLLVCDWPEEVEEQLSLPGALWRWETGGGHLREEAVRGDALTPVLTEEDRAALLDVVLCRLRPVDN